MPRIALVVFVWLLGCGAAAKQASYAVAAAPPPPGAGGATVATSGNAPTTMQIPEALVIEGSISVEVDDIRDIVVAIRAHVEGAGGRVVNENVSGDAESWSAQLKLRLPPANVGDIVAFLASRGDITTKNISATDVSKQLFDQELAIRNLRTTFDRLEKLMATGGLQVAQILEIEREMTRIRGQIDQLEGDNRFLKDRVAYATLDVSLSGRDGAITIAKAKAYPGVRGAALVLFDPGTRKRTRYGAGFVLHTVFRTASLEVDMFQKQDNAAGDDSSVAVLATFGGAAYSDFLGGGRRRVLNPYLGIRLGYGYVDTHRFVLQGEAGVELFKSTYVTVDANLRATGLIGKDSDLALVAGAGATVAF